MVLIIAVITFVTVFTTCFFIYSYYSKDKQVVSARLGQVARNSSVALASPLMANYKETTKLVGGRALIRELSKYFESQQLSRIMEHKLIQAGWLLKGSEFLVICLGVAIVGFSILLLLTLNILLALLGAIVGCFIPVVILNIKIEQRVKAFNEQLGDSLVLIANSLRTGYSFMQTIEMVSREMPQPISVEFGRTLREMNLGVTTEDALNNLAKRISSDDLDLVITAVLIQRQVGGNLAEILDNIAGTIRERVKIKGQIKTLTAQGRISGLVIGIMPIGLGAIIYTINPEYIRVLFTTPIGKMMLIGAVLSEFLGILLIRKIVNIEV